ncbi:MAG TPA: ATP-binding protein [archaeon]|nr:ATP-binding protein [archaeon]
MLSIMDLEKQNPWWKDKKNINNDPKIQAIEDATIKWMPEIITEFDFTKDIVYSLRGPRQTGKTTLTKIIIKNELKTKNPKAIFYFSCDLIISDAKELEETIGTYLDWAESLTNERKLIIIDEISEVKHWEKAIKKIIDERSNKNKTFILTGSHSIDIYRSVEKLPGRRGEDTGTFTHKVFYPMSFKEFVRITKPKLFTEINKMINNDNNEFINICNNIIPESLNKLQLYKSELDYALDEYLLTGGFISVINNYKNNNKIENTLYEEYIRSIFGDFAKVNKNQKYVFQILSSIIKKETSQVSWTAIMKDTHIKDSRTVENYVEILQGMLIVDAFYPIDKNTKQIKYSLTDKKIYLNNPFLFHAFRALINGSINYFEDAKLYLNKENKANLLEFVFGNHLLRKINKMYPSDLTYINEKVYFFKGKKEIDFVIKLENKLIGFEVKYQNQITKSDYSPLFVLDKGVLISKNTFETEKYMCIPISMMLMYL